MATLEIRKETNKVWRHVPSDALPYIVSKLYIKSDGDFIRVVEQGGSQRGQYNFADVSVYNIGGVAETFGSAQQLMERLEALNYIGFFYEGEVSPSELISSDVDNAIELGTDGKLFASISGGGGAVDSVNGQTGVVVLDATDVSALSNDVADYTTATTPLAGTELALVEQGGTFKKVAVSEFGGGGSSETFEQSRWMFNDFYSANNPLNREPFMGVAVNGGAFVSSSNFTVITSGTNANGGFRMITNNNNILSKEGVTFFGIFSLSTDSSARDRVIRMGLHSATNQNAPANGCYIEILGNDLTFKTTASNVTTSSASITLVNGANDLYEVLIHYTADTDVRCIVTKVGVGDVLDTNSTTNIPTLGLNAGIVSHIVTAGANDFINFLDYMGIGQVCPTFLQDRL